MPFMYILECNNEKYYTGSTIDLERRMIEHAIGSGTNFTRKHEPLKLVYLEEYRRIDMAFYREKQVQKWSHEKKMALVRGDFKRLHALAGCRNGSRSAPRLRSGADIRSGAGNTEEKLDSETDNEEININNIPADIDIIKERINKLFSTYHKSNTMK